MIINIVRKILELEFELDVGCVDFSTSFQEDLALDSVMFISLIVGVESRIGIKIPNSLVSEIATVRDLCNLVEKLQEA